MVILVALSPTPCVVRFISLLMPVYRRAKTDSISI